MDSPPRFHCFGHDHDSFGISESGSTVFINGAQEALLQMDKAASRRVHAKKSRRSRHHALLRLGGCALEFDVIPPPRGGGGRGDNVGGKGDGGGGDDGGGAGAMRIVSEQ
jgi:hypothetical protein